MPAWAVSDGLTTTGLLKKLVECRHIAVRPVVAGQGHFVLVAHRFPLIATRPAGRHYSSNTILIVLFAMPFRDKNFDLSQSGRPG
jgi:hypothetical protein